MRLRWALTIGIIALHFWSCGNESSAQKEKSEESSQRTTNVSTFLIQPDSLVQYSRLSATVNAWHDVTISALESGGVIAIHKDVGDFVMVGDTLAQLNVELLDAASIEARANLKFQTYNYERSKKLFSEGSISEQAHFATEYDFNRAKSTDKTLKHRLSYGQIRAPFSGRIAARNISLGQLIPRGGPTFRLVRTDSLRIDAWVAENEIVDFSKGNPVTLTFDALPNHTFSGAIAYVGPAADINRRVFPIEIHLSNLDGHINPGMIGTLQAVRKIYHNMVVIPREAILERETGSVAFVVKNNTAYLRQLSLGSAEADRVVVKSGLNFDDLLIVKGGRDLIDGDKVAIQFAEPAP